MVGLAEATVREARVRVASALARLGILLDEYAITVNLAPAELRKSGASLDLALAAGILAAIGHLPSGALEGVVLLGELSLGGELRPVRGILPQLEGARLRGASSAVLPSANAREAGLVRGLPVYQAEDLAAVRAHLLGERRLSRVQFTAFEPRAIPRGEADLADVRGQHAARRSLEIVAAGHHNLIFIGPPGAGKTLLARLLPTILPPLSFEEAFESTAIHSVAGLLDPAQGIVAVRPFRAPHHSVSEAGLVGGGDVPRPGEVSLAHHGVLFLDELAEFPRSVLEALRQPLEDGRVCIARARARAWFPARPLVVAAVNPCPCGHYGHPTRRCRCSVAERRRYLARLSGPLVDRLDVHVAVPPVEMPALAARGRAESSAVVRERVSRARAIQAERCERGRVSAPYNAALSLSELEQVANLGPAAAKLLAAAVRQLGLSARAFLRVLRVARSIADLEAASDVREEHVAEAVQGRLLDRDDWD
jgi:magnesium chelatase family protein